MDSMNSSRRSRSTSEIIRGFLLRRVTSMSVMVQLCGRGLNIQKIEARRLRMSVGNTVQGEGLVRWEDWARGVQFCAPKSRLLLARGRRSLPRTGAAGQTRRERRGKQ